VWLFSQGFGLLDVKQGATLLCKLMMRGPLAVVLVLSGACLVPPTLGLGGCSSASTYYCPNCGGDEAKDCQQSCSGYLSTDFQSGICINRRLFQPYNDNTDDPGSYYRYLWNDLVAMVVWFFVAGIAISCGVGGGGIYVPLGMLLLQFAPKQASGLSQCSIFGASLGGLLLNLKNRHPVKILDVPHPTSDDATPGGQGSQSAHNGQVDDDTSGGKWYSRPLINYDMVVFLAPAEMAGALLGVTIQRVLPNWLYLLLAGVVLFATGYATYCKAFAVRKVENALKVQHAKHEHGEENAEATETGSWNEKPTEAGALTLTSIGACPEDRHSEPQPTAADPVLAPRAEIDAAEKLAFRRKYLEEDAKQFPAKKYIALAVLWLVLLILTLLLGGKGSPSLIGITCQSPWYYVLLALQFIWLLSFCGITGYFLWKKQTALAAVGYPFLHDDPIWTGRALRNFFVGTFLSGALTGMIGISGGMVLNPLMLHMGVNPVVSSATTATMLVLTSSSIAVMSVTSGLVPVSYAVFFFFVTLTGALVGKWQIDKYVKRTGRASLLVFCLATIIILASVGVFVNMFIRVADAGWCLEGFSPICTSTASSSGECPA
jgi:uncharacterized membrane protein YfcA